MPQLDRSAFRHWLAAMPGDSREFDWLGRWLDWPAWALHFMQPAQFRTAAECLQILDAIPEEE